MENDQYHTRLIADAQRLREIFADDDLTHNVPGCPGWDLADLGQHIGGIYRFATVAIVESRAIDEPTGPRERAALLQWFDEGLAALLAAFESREWSRACWTMAPPRDVGFWIRRMCHETALHLLDAEASQGRIVRFGPALAADGVDEVITMFFPRQVRLGRIQPLSDCVEIVLSDQPGTVPMLIQGDGLMPADLIRPDAVVRGPAMDVLMMLWKRAPVLPHTVEVDGDRAALDRVFATALTP